MLVLSRKLGERIHIGDDVFVEVRRVAGNRVTLAVSAPRNVRILRGELLDAAESFSVLEDDGEHCESTTDTVIIKGAPSEEADASNSGEEVPSSESSFSI